MLIPETFFLVILLQNPVFTHGYEYCSKESEICRSTVKRHIICYKEQIEPDAKYEKHYPMTGLFRNWILYWHNYYRNEVACGKVQGSDGPLPPAPQMRELAWDYELEYIASIHAGRCKMQHDQCRNTERVPMSGQNLAYHRTTGPPRKALDRAKASIYNWFKECADTPVDTIGNYAKLEGLKKIGHFTVLANDKVGRVGCAMTSCNGFPQNAEYVYNFMTCNYDYTNVPGYPVYETGKTASNCKHYNVGKSSNFSCLCDKSF